MHVLWAALPVTHGDIWGAIVLTAIVILLIKACRVKWPDPAIMQSYATIANTPGGIILLLYFLWVFTLITTVAFCIWVLEKGIDSTNGTVVLITGMLSSGAFGAVTGALFSTMTGQDPKPPTTSITEVRETKAATPPAEPGPGEKA